MCSGSKFIFFVLSLDLIGMIGMLMYLFAFSSGGETREGKTNYGNGDWWTETRTDDASGSFVTYVLNHEWEI